MVIILLLSMEPFERYIDEMGTTMMQWEDMKSAVYTDTEGISERKKKSYPYYWVRYFVCLLFELWEKFLRNNICVRKLFISGYHVP